MNPQTDCVKRLLVTSAFVVGAASSLAPASATGPAGPLDREQFGYLSDSYIGPQFGFGVKLDYSTFDAQTFEQQTVSSGLLGNVIPVDEISPLVNGFTGGMPVPVGGLGDGDVFGTDPVPSQINGFEVSSDIAGTGDAMGFNSVQINQRGLVDIVGNGVNRQSGFGESIGQFVFQVDNGGPAGDPIFLELLFFLDALTNFTGDGSVSQGFTAQFLDLSDLDNPMLMNEISGFYFSDESGTFANVTVDGEDMTSLFNAEASEEFTGLTENSINYSQEIEVLTGQTYAVNFGSDVAASSGENGSGFNDSRNTATFQVSLSDPNARIVLPVPEPSGLLGAALFAWAAARRRRGE